VKITRHLPLLAALSLAAPTLHAQAHVTADAPVLMLSDIHLDPFHDPAKLPQLRKAPVASWQAILDAPPTATQVADFTSLQSTCGARGIDTPAALLEASLKAAHTQQPHPIFVTVSGDLMAHQFDCRFHTLAPEATPADYSAFAAKTVAFVALRLRQTFPGIPVYLALGNNDSGCKDYREDPNSAYLQADGNSFASAAAPKHDALTTANRAAIQSEFSHYGDYNIALPIPHTRLIVLQDIFESKKYTACDGTETNDPTTAQTTWLRTQLTNARAAHEHVWIMAHIPPGIDAYTTFTKGRNVCTTGDNGKPTKAEMFLSSEDLASVIAGFPDTIRLALFGHTHMDEMRVYTSPDGTPIPGKLVPSITPVNGNNPAFTVAEVDPRTATLKDYTVFAATKPANWDTAPTWHEEYRFSTTYNLPDLSGPSLAKLTASFLADKTSSTPASQAFQRFYFVGDPIANTGISGNLKAAAMKVVWPAYGCSITQATQAGFKSCVCPAQPAPPSAQ
jgi:sphingomyelin phosphodiesterase acid-like 3